MQTGRFFALMLIIAISLTGCKSDKEEARTLLNEAQILMREHKAKEAKQALESLVKKYPDTEEATEALGILRLTDIGNRIANKKIVEVIENNIMGCLDLFMIDVGRYPTQEEGLDALLKNPGVEGWRGPYIKKLPEDLIYTAPEFEGDDPELKALGEFY